MTRFLTKLAAVQASQAGKGGHISPTCQPYTVAARACVFLRVLIRDFPLTLAHDCREPFLYDNTTRIVPSLAQKEHLIGIGQGIVILWPL